MIGKPVKHVQSEIVSSRCIFKYIRSHPEQAVGSLNQSFTSDLIDKLNAEGEMQPTEVGNVAKWVSGGLFTGMLSCST
jgi:hypothetical protein